MKNFIVICLASIIVIDFSACKKDNDQAIPTGWQENMTGKILFSRNYGSNNTDRLFYWDKNGTKSLPLSGDYNTINGAKWSPDGSQVLFGTHGSGIRIINIDGTGETPVYSNEQGTRGPDWSPDGKRIAFGDYSWIYIITLHGSLYKKVEGGGANLDWSPDGSKIAFNTTMSSYFDHIRILDLSNYSTQELFENLEGVKDYPSWSHDGKQLAFRYHDTDNNSHIFICNSKGENIKQLTHFDKNHYNFRIYQASWSPDGNMLAVGTTDGVYIVNLLGEIITLLQKEAGDANYYVDWY